MAVGFIQGTIDERKNHRLNKLGYTDELYVQNEYRGQGVAEKLFAELEKEFVARGCNHLVTRTDAENTLAQQFYVKIGMSAVTVELWKKLV